MFCSFCGTQLNDGAKFCHACGKPCVQPAQSNKPPVDKAPEISMPSVADQLQPPANKGKKKTIILVVAALAVVIALLISIGGGELLRLFGINANQTIYVMTKQTTYTDTGLELRWTEYQYDAYAQLTQVDMWELESKMAYDPTYDTFVPHYDETCKSMHIGSESYDYDDNGNVIRSNKTQTGISSAAKYTYQYDKAGRILSYSISTGNVEREYQMEYDKNGNLCSVAFNDGYQELISEEYKYDNHNRLIQEIFFFPQGACRIDYVYEGNQLLRAEYYRGTPGLYAQQYTTYSQITTMEYGDKDDREVDQINYDGNCTYDKHGNVIKVEHVSGYYTVYEYEAVKVTAQQATRYERRYGMYITKQAIESIYQENYIYYWMISNPMW